MARDLAMTRQTVKKKLPTIFDISNRLWQLAEAVSDAREAVEFGNYKKLVEKMANIKLLTAELDEMLTEEKSDGCMEKKQ